MSNDRRIDAAIGLLGLGKVYPHTYDTWETKDICPDCGHDVTQEKICYAKVPNYGTDIKDSSELLSILWKVAPHGVDLSYNQEKRVFEFIYKGATPEEDKLFISTDSSKGIREMALYHYKIDINEVTDQIPFNLQV